MNVQSELRHARHAMDDTPIQGVLACMGILGRFPKNPGARRLLAGMDAEQRAAVLRETDALCASGHWVEALHVLAPIGRAHPTDPALAQAETRCLFNLGRFGAILKRLTCPLSLHPDHPGLLATQGIALYRLGDAAAARQILKRAARGRPDDPHIANHLGLVERSTGHLEAATTCFRRAAEGGLVEAWPNLAQMVDFARMPDLVAALDARLSGPLPRHHEELLAFARAKAGFDRGEVEFAFRWLTHANSLHRQAYPYDAAADRARVMDLAGRAPRVTAPPRDAPRVILVVGMPRSGTTLVERILDAHPAVEGLGERPELAALVAQLDTGAAWGPDQVAALGEAYHTGLANCRRSDAAAVVDKMPSNALLAGFALAALPDSRVVHVRRDPVAVALSNLRTRYTASNEFAYDMDDIVDRHKLTEECMDHWRVHFGDRIHTLPMKGLTDTPRQQIAKLLKDLDLPEAEQCVSFTGATGDVRTASAHQVRGPIAPQASANWQAYADHIRPLIDGLAGMGEADP